MEEFERIWKARMIGEGKWEWFQSRPAQHAATEARETSLRYRKMDYWTWLLGGRYGYRNTLEK